MRHNCTEKSTLYQWLKPKPKYSFRYSSSELSMRKTNPAIILSAVTTQTEAGVVFLRVMPNQRVGVWVPSFTTASLTTHKKNARRKILSALSSTSRVPFRLLNTSCNKNSTGRGRKHRWSSNWKNRRPMILTSGRYLQRIQTRVKKTPKKSPKIDITFTTKNTHELTESVECF